MAGRTADIAATILDRNSILKRELMFIYPDFRVIFWKNPMKTFRESEKVIDFFLVRVYTVFGVEYKSTKNHKKEQKSVL